MMAFHMMNQVRHLRVDLPHASRRHSTLIHVTIQPVIPTFHSPTRSAWRSNLSKSIQEACPAPLPPRASAARRSNGRQHIPLSLSPPLCRSPQVPSCTTASCSRSTTCATLSQPQSLAATPPSLPPLSLAPLSLTCLPESRPSRKEIPTVPSMCCATPSSASGSHSPRTRRRHLHRPLLCRRRRCGFRIRSSTPQPWSKRRRPRRCLPFTSASPRSPPPHPPPSSLHLCHSALGLQLPQTASQQGRPSPRQHQPRRRRPLGRRLLPSTHLHNPHTRARAHIPTHRSHRHRSRLPRVRLFATRCLAVQGHWWTAPRCRRSQSHHLYLLTTLCVFSVDALAVAMLYKRNSFLWVLAATPESLKIHYPLPSVLRLPVRSFGSHVCMQLPVGESGAGGVPFEERFLLLVGYVLPATKPSAAREASAARWRRIACDLSGRLDCGRPWRRRRRQRSAIET